MDLTEKAGRDTLVQLYPHLHRVASVAAPADVDPADLVQEALVRYVKRSDLDAVRSPKAYLTRTIVNLASNHRRVWVRQLAALSRLERSHSINDEYPSDISGLECLSPRDRSVLYLHYVEDSTFLEIGRVLNCSGATARKAAERARRQLGAMMKEEAK